jgi:hypothetical protein
MRYLLKNHKTKLDITKSSKFQIPKKNNAQTSKIGKHILNTYQPFTPHLLNILRVQRKGKKLDVFDSFDSFYFPILNI